MKRKKFILLFSIATSLFSLLFSGCDLFESGDSSVFIDKEVTVGQEAITIDASCRTVKLHGVSGKTIYMARINSGDTVLEPKDLRLTSSDGLSNRSSKSNQSENSCEMIDVEDFYPQEKSPRQILEEKLKELMKMPAGQSASLFSKNTANDLTDRPKTFNVGDTTEFYSLNLDDSNSFNTLTYKLLVKDDEYYIWVNVDDPSYQADPEVFKTKAEELGTKFINGYELIRHIYGEPSEKLYNENFASVYGYMSEHSKTGTKINILLYDMLKKGNVYGFVYHGDIVKGSTGSNEGRFLYMDSSTLVNNPLEAYLTAMHEFSHTISFNQKTCINGMYWTYWYGEILAMLCEDMMQAYMGISDSDVNDKLGNTPKNRLSYANSGAFFINGLTGDKSAAYSAIFMLGAWLSRNFGGVKFLKELACNAYVDMESVLMAVNAVTNSSYDVKRLLREYAESLLFQSEGFGLNQDAPTYLGNTAYTHTYFDGSATQIYLYPITAIDLWKPFYAWCTLTNSEGKFANATIPFDNLTAVNPYKLYDWKENTPSTAYLGPILFNNGRTLHEGGIGPYGVMLCQLGSADSDSVTIRFATKDGDDAKDEILLWAK